tara:strand:- start:1019 stop:2515 length:1497 start_codon:yes stop_codon:yes gene_type:complete
VTGRLSRDRLRRSRRTAGCVVLLLAVEAAASNGMNAPGTGAVQLGMAGAGTALASDASATLRNPAAGAWLGNTRTAELGIAIPDGGFRVGPLGENAPFGLLDLKPGRNTSVTGVFPIPSFARNWRRDDRTAVGWGVSASGLKALSEGGSATLARGLPTLDARCDGDFGGGQPLSALSDPSGLCGRSGTTLGVDLTQVLVSAHWAYRVLPSLSVGIAPVFAAQRIEVRGLGAFAAFSKFPERTTNRGFDYSYGGGARIGLLWELGHGIGIGAAYQTRLYQTEFEKYRGAIIGGSLDFAPVLNLGLQFHVIDGHRLFLDYEQVRYGDIRPLANQVEPQRFTDNCFVPRLFTRNFESPPALDACLGASGGPGFGWDTIDVYKIGYQGEHDRLTWRAGLSWGGNPVVRDQTLPKIFAPAITDRHAALGLSWKLSPQLELGWALIYAIKNTIRESNTFSNATPTALQGELLSFDVSRDPADQTIDTHISVWQSQFSLTWSLGE